MVSYKYFLLMLSVCFSYSLIIENVINANSVQVNYSCNNDSSGSYFNPIYCAEAKILGPSPVVDNRISDFPFKVILKYASKAGDYYERQSVSNGCISYYKKYLVSGPIILGNLSVNVLNNTYVLPINSSSILVNLTNLSNVWNETVNISMNLSIIYEYRINAYVGTPINGSCVYSEYTYLENSSKQFFDTKLYIIEGDTPLVILVAPILKERSIFSKNIGFLLFSNRKLHNITVYFNNYSYICNLSNLSIIENNESFYYIRSKDINNCSIMYFNSTPKSFEKENKTFYYVYSINYSCSGGGLVFLVLEDDFGNKFEYNFSIKSKEFLESYKTVDSRFIFIPISLFMLYLFIFKMIR